MTGTVEDRQPVIPVALRQGGRPNLTIEFLLDTGYNGYLTLPPAAVEVLGLSFLDEIPISLASGDIALVPAYAATIVWDGVERLVNVIAMGKRPLLGTALLEELELVVQFRENGLVTVGEI